MRDWFQVTDLDQVDSPALLVYPERIHTNIRRAVDMAGSVNKLRPHVKTNKMPEVCEMMIQAGISKFKCATIAEAEMLAMVDALDVLLAYQPVGPKALRFLKLAKTYRKTHFSCLIDNIDTADELNSLCAKENIVLDIFVDLNVGMNRTGILPERAIDLVSEIILKKHLRIAGLHGYDGHIHHQDSVQRQKAADVAFAQIEEVYNKLTPLFTYPLVIVVGGTPTFPIHARRVNCECSPGTFVFWDWGYKNMFPDMPFDYAALLVGRVISIVDKKHVCIDLGYKSVASESPLPRVCFLNKPEAKPVAHSEEHLVLEVPESSSYTVGDVLYGVPLHICPTVALYEKAFVVRNQEISGSWDVSARNRSINL